MVELFFKLLFVFSITDVALQTDWMSLVKCNSCRSINIPWYYGMGSHSMVNGAGVWIVTGNVYIGILESILHFIIDFLKCKAMINQHLDFIAHIGCRVLYAAIFIYWTPISLYKT